MYLGNLAYSQGLRVEGLLKEKRPIVFMCDYPLIFFTDTKEEALEYYEEYMSHRDKLLDLGVILLEPTNTIIKTKFKKLLDTHSLSDLQEWVLQEYKRIITEELGNYNIEAVYTYMFTSNFDDIQNELHQLCFINSLGLTSNYILEQGGLEVGLEGDRLLTLGVELEKLPNYEYKYLGLSQYTGTKTPPNDSIVEGGTVTYPVNPLWDNLMDFQGLLKRENNLEAMREMLYGKIDIKQG